MKLRIGSLAFGAVSLAACSLSAQTALVSWGPSTTLMDIGTGASQRGDAVSGGYDFDLTTPISPWAINPNNNRVYSGSPYYGGVVSANAPSQNAGVSIRNAAFGSGIDAQIFGRSGGTTAGYSTTGVFLWKQENFISGASASSNVTITSLSYDALLLSGAGNNLEARFVIQQGSTYMISANLGLATYSEVHTLNNLASTTWYSYSPVVRSIGSAAIGTEALSAPSFSGVTAVGLYLTGTSTAGTGLTTDAFILAFSQFTANGTVSAIPEPSSAAVLVGLGALASVGLRRRKRFSSPACHE